MSFRTLSTTLWVLSAFYLVSIAIVAPFGGTHVLPLIGPIFSRPDLHFADKAAPIAILALFAWVLFEIVVKQLQVRREHEAVAAFQFHAQMAEEQSGIQPIKAPAEKAPRAVRRANLIAECRRRDPMSLHEAVPAVAALDANSLAASYSPLNVYAWVLPVLGFIGTASGMASAIGGFKDALGGGQVQLDALASKLSQSVIPGLASAFETTILALTAALVAYLCTSAIRSWDQEALNELDRLSILLLSQLPQPDTGGQSIAAGLTRISDQLQAVVEMPSELQHAAVAINDAAMRLDTAASAAAAIALAADALASASNQTGSASAAIDAAAQTLISASKELKESTSLPYHITITRESL